MLRNEIPDGLSQESFSMFSIPLDASHVSRRDMVFRHLVSGLMAYFAVAWPAGPLVERSSSRCSEGLYSSVGEPEVRFKWAVTKVRRRCRAPPEFY